MIWLVVGAGYTGARVAAALAARGDEVIATRRREAPTIAGVRGIAAELAQVEIPTGATVVITAPPSEPAGAAEAALAAVASARAARRIIYVSSTGVYAPAAGAWVDEDFAIAPTTATGRARVAAEQALTAGQVPCVRLRVAGIYGPDRGVVARLRAGSYRLIGDGSSYVSRVHVDDLVAAMVAAGDAAAPSSVYNVADLDPCSSRELALTACAALGLPPPPSVPIDAVDIEVAGMLTADRRIDSRRLVRELGWTPRYPSWRDGLAAELGESGAHRPG